jgi:hypothetical protein
MTLSLGGWSALGIAAAICIVAGIVLLVAFAAGRGLVHRELDALEPDPGIDAPPAGVGSGPTGNRDASRTLGIAGAALLVVGLVLGLASAVAGWDNGGSATGGGPGAAPLDCAQSWNGCPQATPGP